MWIGLSGTTIIVGEQRLHNYIVWNLETFADQTRQIRRSVNEFCDWTMVVKFLQFNLGSDVAIVEDVLSKSLGTKS